jgi:hypothetical protein
MRPGNVIETNQQAGISKSGERGETKSRHAVKRDGFLLFTVNPESFRGG